MSIQEFGKRQRQQIVCGTVKAACECWCSLSFSLSLCVLVVSAHALSGNKGSSSWWTFWHGDLLNMMRKTVELSFQIEEDGKIQEMLLILKKEHIF